jgi:hypothetical protein
MVLGSAAWAAGAVVLVRLGIDLDRWVGLRGWFPRSLESSEPAAVVGAMSIAVALSAFGKSRPAWTQRAWRGLLGGVLTGLATIGLLWAMRYLVWATHGAGSIETLASTTSEAVRYRALMWAGAGGAAGISAWCTGSVARLLPFFGACVATGIAGAGLYGWVDAGWDPHQSWVGVGLALWVWGFGAYSLRPRWGPISDRPKGARWWMRLAAPIAAIGLGLLLCEVLVRAIGLDDQMVARALYYQEVELEVHRISADPGLHFELMPGVVLGGEGPWGIREVRVNRHGARAPERPLVKPAGIYRILCFGGSTLYGAGVNNWETTPARLQRVLNRSASDRRTPGVQSPRFEAWNFGTSAYNQAQMARLARAKMTPLGADLVVIMLTNTGRRAFLGGPTRRFTDHSAYFDDDPWLYLENFPPVWGVQEGVHHLGLQHVGLYRYVVAWARRFQDPKTTRYADIAGTREAIALEQAAQEAGIEVVYVLAPSRGSEVGPVDVFPELESRRFIDLNEPGRSGAYADVHPPPEVLEEYAERIASTLIARGFLPNP